MDKGTAQRAVYEVFEFVLFCGSPVMRTCRILKLPIEKMETTVQAAISISFLKFSKNSISKSLFLNIKHFRLSNEIIIFLKLNMIFCAFSFILAFMGTEIVKTNGN